MNTSYPKGFFPILGISPSTSIPLKHTNTHTRKKRQISPNNDKCINSTKENYKCKHLCVNTGLLKYVKHTSPIKRQTLIHQLSGASTAHCHEGMEQPDRKTNKGTSKGNFTTEQMDLTHMDRTPDSCRTHILLSAHGTLPGDHMSGHKTSLNKQ